MSSSVSPVRSRTPCMSPLTLRHKLRPPRSVFFPPNKTEVLSRPCLRISPASAVLLLRSEHASGIFLPRFILHHSHPHPFCSQFVHKNQDSRKLCLQFASVLAVYGNAKQKREIMENNFSTQALSYSRNSLKAPLLTLWLPDSDLSVPHEPLLNSEPLSAPR